MENSAIIFNEKSINRFQKLKNGIISLPASLKSFIEILTELTKFRITFFVSVTTAVGFILHSGELEFNMLLPIIGVLILASGASALNEYQEKDSDSLMERTKLRPIPSGIVSSSTALFISLLLILIGSIILIIDSLNVFLLSIFTFFWYNFIYTPLKHKTAYAIIPGSLVGAIPPIIGWTSSGGNLFNAEIFALSSFLFIWQIPHFWLLLLIYDEQYNKAGFPTLTKTLSNNKILSLSYFLIILLVLSSFGLIISSDTSGVFTFILFIILGVFTALYSFKIISKKQKISYRKVFLLINLYVLLVLFVISIEKLINF